MSVTTAHKFGVLVLLAALVGCNKGDKPEPKPDGGGGPPIIPNVGGGGGGGGVMGVLPVAGRKEALEHLRQIGLAYQQAALLGTPPRSAAELGNDMRKLLVSPRDNKPYVIVWSVDPVRVQDKANVVLAWEEVGDGQGGHCVLMADYTPRYMTKDEYDKATPAKPNR